MERPSGKRVLIFFAVFLLVLSGTASAAFIINPSPISEYPTALIQPYSGTWLSAPVSPGYTGNLPLYSDILPLYTPVSPSFTPASSPLYQPVEIKSPVYSP